jgi:thermostable 8-oxoguanine DNA glycosylase
LKGKTDEEVEEHLKVVKKDFEARFATYIANTMLQFQDREAIMAPYNFN